MTIATALMLACLCPKGADVPHDGALRVEGELRVELEYRGFRQFEFELPDELFLPVGDGIPVPHAGGDCFKARVDGARLMIDATGDDTFKALVEPPPEGTTATVTLRGKDSNGAPIQYVARVRVGASGWEYSTSGALVGNVGATKIVVVDQDLDGLYGEPGEDALVVGRGRVATPMSKVVMLDDGALYHAELDGRTLILRPYVGAVGTLDVLSGFETRAKVMTLQVGSAADDVYFDLSRRAEGAVVPVGEYTVENGLLAQGDNRVSIANGRLAPLTVTAGETTRLEWGGPISAEFDVHQIGSTFNFAPNELWYHGRAGEEYFNWTPLGASPRFVLVDAATGSEVASGIFAGT